MTLDKFCYKVEIVITTINFFQFFRLWKYCKVLKLTQIYNCKICGTNLSGEIEKKILIGYLPSMRVVDDYNDDEASNYM